MTGVREDSHFYGISRREQQVLELRDAGLSDCAIARETGLTQKSVRSAIYRRHDDGRDAWKANAKAGSDALLRALRKHFPERCGASYSNSRSRPLAPAGAARDIPPRAAPTPYSIGGEG